MFSGLAWYWWLVIGLAVVISIPFKIKFMKRRDRSRQEKNKRGKWGDEE